MMWTIQAREGFAVGGETIELLDESSDLIDITDLGITMRIVRWDCDEEFNVASGNFSVVEPVAPAVFPSQWEFTMTPEQVQTLKDGVNRFRVLISDQNDVLVGELLGEIVKA